MTTASFERLKGSPALGVLFRRIMGLVLILTGLVYVANPVDAASYLGVNVDNRAGEMQIRGYYGGGQIGLGTFMLIATTNDALRMLFYAMSFLASARCFCTLPFVVDMAPTPFADRKDRFTHILIALLIEYPCALIAMAALYTWAPEYTQEELRKERDFIRRIGKDLKNSRGVKILRFGFASYLFIVGLSFTFAPRWTGHWYEIYAGFGLGIIELQSMLGALRIGLAVFVLSCHSHSVILLFACIAGFKSLLDVCGILFFI